jgi:hypothetical protein
MVRRSAKPSARARDGGAARPRRRSRARRRSPPPLTAAARPPPQAHAQPGGRRHTILLLQPDAAKASRTYFDFQALEEALQGICSVFEGKLRELNPGRAQLTYDVADLFAWLDRLPDLSVLIYEPRARLYEPHGRAFVKAQLHAFFAAQQQRGAAPRR